MRLKRLVTYLSTPSILLLFTILFIMAKQQHNVAHHFRQVFRNEYPLKNYTDETLLLNQKFMEIDARMDARREYLRSECSRLSLNNTHHKTSSREYLINRQYHVIWCNIFKAASTSWMYNFNLMANYTAAFLDTTIKAPYELARKRYGRPSVETLKKAQRDSITFLIVRHPFERLVSAYNDKIVNVRPKSINERRGQKIIKKYRKKTTKPAPTEWYPLFEEFVSYVLDEAKFTRKLDMHWTPYTDFCTPCQFDLDVILKFETLDEDQRFLIQVARLQKIVKPEWQNSGNGPEILHNVNHLYSRLNKSQLDGLYNLYKYDFQLFNYTVAGYYDLIKKDDSKSV